MALKYSKFRIKGLALIVKIKNYSVIVNAVETIVEKKNRRTEQKFKIYDDKG